MLDGYKTYAAATIFLLAAIAAATVGNWDKAVELFAFALGIVGIRAKLERMK